MYWFRGENLLQLVPWLLVTAGWAFGGWLIASHAFRLERRERLVAGVGTGLVAYVWFANLLGRWLPAWYAFSLAGLAVLLSGLAFSRSSERSFVDWGDLRQWRLLLAGLLLVVLFTRIGQGTTLFDEWKNLSIISTMAAGDIPPHFYMNSTVYFPYHYAFQLFGASMVRLGGFLPWSAFDFSKAIAGALLILTTYLLGARLIQHKSGGLALAVVVTFATGTRYLLLLLPNSVLAQIDGLVSFGPGTVFSQMLVSGWDGEATPLFPFMRAFMNGIQAWPVFFGMQAGPSTLGLLIFFLIWLVKGRSSKPAATVMLALLFATWALSWEASYSLFFLGGALVSAANLLRRRTWRGISQLEAALWLSLPVALLQGGTLTEMLGSLWGSPVAGPASSAAASSVAAPSAAALSGAAESAGLAGFGLRWPPAIISAHLSDLHLTSPLELLVALCEIGPVIFFVPWITRWAWRKYRQGDWLHGALALSAIIGFWLPVFFAYKVDRDITRFMAYSLDLWLVLLVILLFEVGEKRRRAVQAGVIALLLSVYGGVVLSGTSLAYTTRVAFGISMTPLDTYVAAEFWDRLEPGGQVFDHERWRAVALTGRLTTATDTLQVPLLAWQALDAQPTVEALRRQGYSYIYLDESWWRNLPGDSRNSLRQPCVQTLAEYELQLEFRRLLDIRDCPP